MGPIGTWTLIVWLIGGRPAQTHGMPSRETCESTAELVKRQPALQWRCAQEARP